MSLSKQHNFIRLSDNGQKCNYKPEVASVSTGGFVVIWIGQSNVVPKKKKTEKSDRKTSIYIKNKVWPNTIFVVFLVYVYDVIAFQKWNAQTYKLNLLAF